MKTLQARHSKVLTLLSLAQAGKFYSHFGFRTLLILYMVQQLKFTDSHAFGINAVFCGLCELGGIFGGLIADRYLGLKKGMTLGGWLLAIGYLSLAFEGTLFFSMGLIIAGASLFSGNITALLGLVYSENDPRRQRGFTIFYMMQNFGALLSTLICGLIVIHYGFCLGFAIVSIGMIIGCLVLMIGHRTLDNLEELPVKKNPVITSVLPCLILIMLGILGVIFETIVVQFLPWITGGIVLFFINQLLRNGRWQKEQIYTLLVYLCSIVLFFAVEDQICSSLLLFAERETKRTFLGWVVPSSFITTINPIVILLFGALIGRKNSRTITPFILTAGAFGILGLFCLIDIDCSIFTVMTSVIIISISELMIGPLVISKISEIAAKRNTGMIMGMIPIAFSLAFQFSGNVSKLVSIEDQSVSLQVYGFGFTVIAFLILSGGIIIHVLMKKFTYERLSIIDSFDKVSNKERV